MTEAHPLTRYRQRHNLTLRAFAKLVPTTPATISRIENGNRQPALALLRLMVAATGGEVSADDIINFDTGPPVQPLRQRGAPALQS